MILVDLPREAVLQPGWWAVSPGVPKRERPPVAPAVTLGPVEPGTWREALDALANAGGASLQYDQWRDVIFAIHHETGGSAEGLALAQAWSSRSEKHDGAFLENRVWPYVKAGGGITGRTVMSLATRLAGWQGPDLRLNPDDFGVVGRGHGSAEIHSVRGSDGGAGGAAGAVDRGAGGDVLRLVPQDHGPGAPAVADEAPEPEEWPLFKRDKAGKIEPTVTNAVLALRRPDLCGEQVAYDEFRDEITVSKPGTVRAWVPMTDADVVRMRMRLEAIGFKSVPKELARDALVLVAAEAKFDSARMWLEDVETRWDGKRRVEEFLLRYMGVEDDARGYVRAVGRYLWTALAGRVLQPGVKADMVVIYEGPQGVKKSTAIEALVPGPEFFVEVDLGEDEADTVRKLRGALVGEIAELSGLHTRALEDIKKFVVRRVEKWVPKYKEFPSVFARRLVFLGTTNRTDILADETGNRRWLPVHVERSDVDAIVRDREQLWAEGAAMFRAEGVAWEAAERLAAGVVHDAYTIEDAWSGAVATWLAERDPFEAVPDGADAGAVGGGGAGAPGGVSPVAGDGSGGRGGSGFTTSDCLAGALRLATRDMDRLAQKRVSAILRRFGYHQQTVRISGIPTWGWRKAE